MNKFFLALSLALVCLTSKPAVADPSSELKEPPVFTSSNHELDLLIIARTKRIELGEFSPTGWIYEVCYRADALGDSCPPGGRTASEYGGMRLQMEPGDHLKMHLINKLPPAPSDAVGLQSPMGALLVNNPTNLHTHGLIVEPRKATDADPTYGDYVYVMSYPHGRLPNMGAPGFDLTEQPVDYDIYLPQNHPSGLYWIHPHVHGLAMNQVSLGLSGIITVGAVNDYISGSESKVASNATVRHFVLKDMEVLPDGSPLSQADSQFCTPDPVAEPAREGFCSGTTYVDELGVHSYVGGKWFFSVNGQVYPTVHAGSNGEIWRLTQGSGSRTYQIGLEDNATHEPIVFQVLALDGVTLDAMGGSDTVVLATGGKLSTVPCPASLGGVPNAVCATGLHLMPSSRAEIWIPPMMGRSSADLVTYSYNTGPAGDYWPSAKLAHVVFPPTVGTESTALTVKSRPGLLLASGGLLNSDVKIDGGKQVGEIALNSADHVMANLVTGDRAILQQHVTSLSAPSALPTNNCAPLPSGHRRRIFFGLPPNNPNGFGVGYEEIDSAGNPVPGTFQEIAPFDDTIVNVCVPLAAGNKTMNEVWDLVNVAGEDHNFHIHQTKFQVLTTTAAAAPPDALMDNVPLIHGSDGCDGSVASWRAGACVVTPVSIMIPFSEVGDFVYHCHILDHEDGGMMAHIRVVPAQ